MTNQKREVESMIRKQYGEEDGQSLLLRQRLKILYLEKLFQGHSDKTKALSMAEIIGHLQAYGVRAERKALYKDIEALRYWGLDIVCEKGRQTTYYLRRRSWSAQEILADLTDCRDLLPIIYTAVLGVLVGDALGVPVEFMKREDLQRQPVTTMREYGVHNQPAGTWSDDGSLTLATIAALAEPFSYEHMMVHFLLWLEEGQYSATGKVFDYGYTTSEAILRYKDGAAVDTCGARHERSNGNGSLMRILPLVFYLRHLYGAEFYRKREAMDCIHRISALTHGHPISQMACGLYLCIANVLVSYRLEQLTAIGEQGIADDGCCDEGSSLNDLLAQGLAEGFTYYERDIAFQTVLPHFARLKNWENFSKLPVDNIDSSGYVVATLEAALWSLSQTQSFSSALCQAVNLGKDTDTVGAVIGGLAALYYGAAKIPKNWLEVLPKQKMVYELCQALSRNLM